MLFIVSLWSRVVGIPVIGTNGRLPGLFVQVSEDFSLFPYYFSIFVRVLGFFLEWAKKRNGCCWWGRNGFAFFLGGTDGRTAFCGFFSQTLLFHQCSQKDRKLSPSLKKKSFFLLLFLFQRQNGKSCSMSSGRDEAVFPSGMCEGCRLGRLSGV